MTVVKKRNARVKVVIRMIDRMRNVQQDVEDQPEVPPPIPGMVLYLKKSAY